jgi:hypothetical protein
MASIRPSRRSSAPLLNRGDHPVQRLDLLFQLEFLFALQPALDLGQPLVEPHMRRLDVA